MNKEGARLEWMLRFHLMEVSLWNHGFKYTWMDRFRNKYKYVCIHGLQCTCGCGLIAQLWTTLCDPWTVACQASCPWDSPGKNTGVGGHFLLRGILPTQASKLGLLLGRWILDWATTEPHSMHTSIILNCINANFLVSIITVPWFCHIANIKVNNWNKYGTLRFLWNFSLSVKLRYTKG